MISLFASFFAIPNKPGNPSISVSIKAYWPLLRSQRLMSMVFSICLLIVSYWVFIGMAPILYMESLGVSLKHFGLYQGSLSLVFGMTSILSPKLLKRYGQVKCFNFGKWVCIMSAILIMAIPLLGIDSPLVITSAILIFSLGAVFPINILYPYSLEIIDNAKAKTAALVQGLRLILTAIILELVSYFYQDNFNSIAMAMVICLIISFILIQNLLRKGLFIKM